MNFIRKHQSTYLFNNLTMDQRLLYTHKHLSQTKEILLPLKNLVDATFIKSNIIIKSLYSIFSFIRVSKILLKSNKPHLSRRHKIQGLTNLYLQNFKQTDRQADRHICKVKILRTNRVAKKLPLSIRTYRKKGVKSTNIQTNINTNT